jgi:5-carboxyvanillate decarboxylase
MKRIAFEEHFYTQELMEHLKSRKDFNRLEITVDEKGNKVERLHYFEFYPGTIDALADMGEGRLKVMDEAGIDFAVLSLGNPGAEIFDVSTGKNLARSINNELFAVIQKYPNRFAGFATLAYQEPVSAAIELERAVKELGMKGAKIHSHLEGEFLDQQKYWVLFEAADKLGVPLYLHPKMPSPDMAKPYFPYSALAGPMFGFGVQTGLQALRLICSGLFDRYPNLKIILGHLGEALPFWLWRLDKPWRDGHKPDPQTNKLKKRPSEYFKDNFFVTTSGMFWEPALVCSTMALGADKILFAVDHPFESSKRAVEFMDAASITNADKEKIYHTNAEKLLSL